MLNFLFKKHNARLEKIEQQKRELMDVRHRREEISEENEEYRCRIKDHRDRMEAFWNEMTKLKGEDDDR